MRRSASSLHGHAWDLLLNTKGEYIVFAILRQTVIAEPSFPRVEHISESKYLAPMAIRGRSLVQGTASGDLLVSNTSLSFWGGIEAETGIIVDRHHPLRGECITGRIFAIPSGRGSCTGSGVLLELLMRKRAPAALIFQHVDQILTLGVMVAEAMFALSIPVLVLPLAEFCSLSNGTHVEICDSDIFFGRDVAPRLASLPSTVSHQVRLKLSPRDESMLAGSFGPGVQLAMEILVNVAEMQGAEALLDVSQAHIDACIYIGPASNEFAEIFSALGARFVVPTTLNSISIDKRRWRELGMDPGFAKEAERLAQTYMAMGAAMSFTCAPYLLETAPKIGEDVGWAESNAVVFANSVLGARTQKYPDFLDVCIALTGRAPASGCHLDEQRLAKLQVNANPCPGSDDAFWPLLGYYVGKVAGSEIPLICGLEETSPSTSDLKAFGAAFATTASAPMFHIRGVTPEALSIGPSRLDLEVHVITHKELKDSWVQLYTASDASVGLVSLGNPHFSFEEFASLAELCSGRQKDNQVELVITTSRAVRDKATAAGFVDIVESFGASIITDTCWCMISEPVIPVESKNIMTNSAKYAHYAPGMVQRGVHFGSLSSCVEAACSGRASRAIPAWLHG